MSRETTPIGLVKLIEELGLDEIKEIVDMPDKRASLLARLIMQNKGKLAESKRDLFSEITDDELARMEQAVAKVEE